MNTNYLNYINSRILERLQKRGEIIKNIIQLNEGNDSGIVFLQDWPVKIKGADRIPAMLKKEWSDLVDLDLRLVEYCRIAGVPNPFQPI